MRDLTDFTKMTYYEILDVDPSASIWEIQQAYENALRLFQSNSVGIYTLFSKSELEQIRKRIQEAYDALNDAESRRNYQKSLGIHVPEEEPELALSDSFSETPKTLETGLMVEREEPGEEEEVREEEIEEEIRFYSGRNLKKLREINRITIKTIAGITKISPIFLNKIEKDEYQGLPERVFVRGFIIEFAKCLKIDPEKAVHDFLQGYDQWLEEKKNTVEGRDRRRNA